MNGVRVALLLIATCLALAAPAAAGPLTPAFHEEVGRAWGEFSEHIRSLGTQVEQHLRGLPGVAVPTERPLVSFMLDHKAELGLTADQVSRLETLRAEFTRDAIRRDAEIRIAEMDLAALSEQNLLDLPKVEAKIREVAQLRAELRIARLRTIEQGKALLSTEQRARLEGLLGRSPRRAAERATRP